MTRPDHGKWARALTGAMLVAALTSCGLKGDLYLPEPEQAAAADQTRNPDSIDTTKAITTTANGSATAADEDNKKTAGQPSEGTSPTP